VVLPRPSGGSLLVGVKRALAFAPRRGKKAKKQGAAGLTAGWVMHEYRLAAALHKNVRTNSRLLPYPTLLFVHVWHGLLVMLLCSVAANCFNLPPFAVTRN
jgi:hypothetical protein